MKNITYLIGAGASYQSLPLMADLLDRLKIFFIYLKDNSIEFKDVNLEPILEDFNLIIKQVENRTTIDAYAKELAIQDTIESNLILHKIKLILSAFFAFEQISKSEGFRILTNEKDFSISPAPRIPFSQVTINKIKKSIDNRYRKFWGNYLTAKSKKLPSNINIISWNYDMQFELSYYDIVLNDLDSIINDLQIFPSSLDKVDFNMSSIIKMNGTAGFYFFSGSNKIVNIFNNNNDVNSVINTFLRMYDINTISSNSSYPIFSFAWENNDKKNQATNYAKAILSQTDILVVIGYSFPDFNREIDRFIFEEANKLEVIYLQAPIENNQTICNELSHIKQGLHKIVTSITDLSSFTVPGEYYQTK